MVMELVTRAGRYAPTPDDVLWLARAVQAEGAPRVRVAQTLVNGFLWARDELGSKRTLAQWVRAYAQPVNPDWMPGGKHYERELAAATLPVAKERIRSAGFRRQREHATRLAFTPDTRRAVELALSKPPELPGAVDYAAAWIDHKPPWVAFTPPIVGQNRFWSRPGAVGWAGYVVEGAEHLKQSKGWPWLIGIAGLLLAWSMRK